MGGYEMGEMLGLCPPAGGGGIGWVLDGQTLTFDGQRDRPSNEGEHYSQNDQPTDRPTDRPTNRPTKKWLVTRLRTWLRKLIHSPIIIEKRMDFTSKCSWRLNEDDTKLQRYN